MATVKLCYPVIASVLESWEFARRSSPDSRLKIVTGTLVKLLELEPEAKDLVVLSLLQSPTKNTSSKKDGLPSPKRLKAVAHSILEVLESALYNMGPDEDLLREHLQELADQHLWGCQVKAGFLPQMKTAFLYSLSKELDSKWSVRLEHAWATLCDYVVLEIAAPFLCLDVIMNTATLALKNSSPVKSSKRDPLPIVLSPSSSPSRLHLSNVLPKSILLRARSFRTPNGSTKRNKPPRRRRSLSTVPSTVHVTNLNSNSMLSPSSPRSVRGMMSTMTPGRATRRKISLSPTGSVKEILSLPPGRHKLTVSIRRNSSNTIHTLGGNRHKLLSLSRCKSFTQASTSSTRSTGSNPRWTISSPKKNGKQKGGVTTPRASSGRKMFTLSPGRNKKHELSSSLHGSDFSRSTLATSHSSASLASSRCSFKRSSSLVLETHVDENSSKRHTNMGFLTSLSPRSKGKRQQTTKKPLLFEPLGKNHQSLVPQFVNL